MDSAWKQDVRNKLKHYQYLFEYASTVICLVLTGYALKYAVQLYSAGNLGLSIQVGGIGVLFIFAALSTFAEAFIYEGLEDGSGAEGEDGRSETDSNIPIVILLLGVTGLAMLIGGHYV